MFLRAHIALLVRISGWHRARMGTGAGTLCSPHRLSMSATLHMHVQAKRVIFHGSACLHSSLSLGSMWKKKPSSTTSIYNRLPLLRPLHQVCQFITNFCGAMWHVCHMANFDSSFDRGSHILPHQCWSPKCSSRRLIDCWFFAACVFKGHQLPCQPHSHFQMAIMLAPESIDNQCIPMWNFDVDKFWSFKN